MRFQLKKSVVPYFKMLMEDLGIDDIIELDDSYMFEVEATSIRKGIQKVRDYLKTPTGKLAKKKFGKELRRILMDLLCTKGKKKKKKHSSDE